MKRILLVSLLLSIVALSLPAQGKMKPYTKFWVSFTDKDFSPYSVLKPHEFLSPRAIERRNSVGFLTCYDDLPVSQRYLDSLRSAGAEVMNASKWMNGATIFATPETMFAITNLPFIKDIKPIGIGGGRKVTEQKPPRFIVRDNDYLRTQNYYGEAANQVEMLNVHLLQSLGFKGQGKVMAIFDGGFNHVNAMPAFDSLRANHKIWGTFDMVEGDTFVYESSTHGTNVLSCIASNLPGQIMGTGQYADGYYLFKTEDVTSEYPIEEYNWLSAAEKADSLGVDIINSSLGYTSYDDTNFSYKYTDLNGDKTAIAQAADMAAARGLLIVNSAGNEGSNSWKYVGSPADADSILTVGSVDKNQKKSGFSSFGPTTDGRIKPTTMARGSQTAVANLTGYGTASANGTSFSAPVMAGSVATLWSSAPESSNWEIIESIRTTSSLASAPTDGLGYGLGNIAKAYIKLTGRGAFIDGEERAAFQGGLVQSKIDVFYGNSEDGELEWELRGPLGHVLQKGSRFVKQGRAEKEHFDLRTYPDGCFTFHITRTGNRQQELVFCKYSRLKQD